MSQEPDPDGAVSAPPATNGNTPSEKLKIVSVRSRFDARPTKHVMGDLRLRVGNKVIVKTEDGEEEFGEVTENPRIMDARFFNGDLPEVLRHASETAGPPASGSWGRRRDS